MQAKGGLNLVPIAVTYFFILTSQKNTKKKKKKKKKEHTPASVIL